MTRSPSAPLGVALLSAVRHQDYLSAAFAANPHARIVAVGEEPDVPEHWRHLGPAMAERFGVPYVDGVEPLLARPDVELVCVGSEETRHGRLAVRVLEAGKHLLLDKPMATRLEECRAIEAAALRAEGRGRKAMTVSRFMAPAVQRAKAAIEAGAVGEIIAVHAALVAGYGPGDAFDPVLDDHSYHPRWTGGGEILRHALYPVTNVRYLTGREILAVQCFGGARFNRAHREYGIEDCATMLLSLDGGATATIVVGRAATPAHPARSDTSALVVGTRGRLTADEHRPFVAVYGAPEVGVRSHEYDADVIQPLVDHVVSCVLHDRAPSQTIGDSVRVMEVVFAAIESLQLGRTVPVVASPPAPLHRDGERC